MPGELLRGFGDGGVRRPELEVARHGGDGIETEAAFGEFDEELLRVEAMAIAEMREAAGFVETDVFAVGHQYASLQSVAEVRSDHFGEKLIAERRVAQTEDHLDALVNIALHPIGAAEK